MGLHFWLAALVCADRRQEPWTRRTAPMDQQQSANTQNRPGRRGPGASVPPDAVHGETGDQAGPEASPAAKREGDHQPWKDAWGWDTWLDSQRHDREQLAPDEEAAEPGEED